MLLISTVLPQQYKFLRFTIFSKQVPISLGEYFRYTLFRNRPQTDNGIDTDVSTPAIPDALYLPLEEPGRYAGFIRRIGNAASRREEEYDPFLARIAQMREIRFPRPDLRAW